MELALLKSTSQLPWFVGGDFNSIKSISERVGCTRMDRDMRDFIDFINIMELQDLPLLGRKFTWSNFQDVEIQSRIDRFVFLKNFWTNLISPNGGFIGLSLITPPLCLLKTPGIGVPSPSGSKMLGFQIPLACPWLKKSGTVQSFMAGLVSISCKN